MPLKLGPVLVCKEFSEIYQDALTRKGFDPYFLQVLDTCFVNEEQLQETILAGPEGNVDAVILTSSRAADAWNTATQKALQSSSDVSKRWREVEFYVVGKATAKALRSAPNAPTHITGAESGTGEALARFIVARKGERKGEETLPLLLLVGDKNKESIPDILSEGELSYRKLQVYKTGPVDDLADQVAVMTRRMLQVDRDHDSPPPWVIFFSPSTVDYVISAIKSTTKTEEIALNPLSRFRIATIGPTTANHLQDLKYRVLVSSTKPDPESLAESLEAACSKPE